MYLTLLLLYILLLLIDLLHEISHQKNEQTVSSINLLSESICSITYLQMKELIDTSFCENLLLLLKAVKQNPDMIAKTMTLIERITFVGAHEARLQAENRFYIDFSKTGLLKEIGKLFTVSHDWMTPQIRDSAIHSYAFLMKRRMVPEETLGTMSSILVQNLSLNVQTATQRRMVQRTFFALYCLIESRSLFTHSLIFLFFLFSNIIHR